MELQNGRPLTNEGRLEKEIRVYDLLDSLKVSYQRADHEAAYTMEACAEVDRLLEVNACKNLFLTNRQKTNFYLLLMPADKPFKTKDFSKQLGLSRLSFGSSEDMERLLDVTPGSVTVMGLMNDPNGTVQLFIDEDVLKEEYFGCHPCINTSSLKLKTSDIVEKVIPAMGHTFATVTL